MGREDLVARASTSLALKSWMASRTVCCPQPRFSAICGTSFPFEEARTISGAFIEEKRQALPARVFEQEYSCQFVELDDAVFTLEDVNRAITDEVSPLFEEAS